MATRESLEDKLAAIRGLGGRALTEQEKIGLKKRVGDRSNFVVAAAAEIVGANLFLDMADGLVGAFERFLMNPLKDDKLCRAKLAIVQALERMEYDRPEIFLKASKCVQMEPVWGGSEDTAVPVRATGLIALARIEGQDSLPILVDAMIDKHKDVRIAAAVGLGVVGNEAAGLVLRMKVRLGDQDPDVLSECLGAMLLVDPKQYMSLVTEFLKPINEDQCEAAAMALGRSRLAEALGPLKECFEQAYSTELRQHLLLAVAILRRADAIDYLIEMVANEDETKAREALTALRIYKDDPRLHERIGQIVLERKSRAVQAAFNRDFE